LAARGKNPIPPAARNFVWCGDCRVRMAYFWRKAIHHNSKTLLQKKAMEKWYRAVAFKNLTERSEGISLAANWQRNARVKRVLRGKHAAMRGKNKTLPTRPEAFWKSSNRGEKLRSLRLGSRRLRRCRSGFWGSRLRWCGCSGLDRIGLIVEAHNVLRDVDLRGSKENRSVLRRGIENDDIAVFAGIAVQHVDHFAADAINDVGLRGVHIFLVFRVHAIETLG